MLNLPENLEYSIMINAKDFVINKTIDKKNLDHFFVNKKKSKISIIRIATNYNELEASFQIAKFLSKKNYKIFLNIMQITTLNNNEIS